MYITVAGSLHSVNPTEYWGAIPGVEEVSEFSPGRLRHQREPRVHVLRLANCEQEAIRTWTAFRKTVTGTLIAWLPTHSTKDLTEVLLEGNNGVVTDESSVGERSLILEAALQKGTEFGQAPGQIQGMIGQSGGMTILREVIHLVSPRKCTILITGETGVGKEVVARAIHDASPRANYPMVSLNCSAIPGELLEAELFGSVKGAYTGAHVNRKGRFEQADKGTLFLDEIGDLPLPLQAKLLRVLQEREFERLGSSTTVQVDVRIIAATHANLQDLVQRGKFRQDLYYRLKVVPIEIPPLRERREDIPDLVSWFVSKVCASEQIAPKSVGPEIVNWLTALPWFGNVRELENAIEGAIAMSGQRPALTKDDFAAFSKGLVGQSEFGMFPANGINYHRVVAQFERGLIVEALRLSGGSRRGAASLLQLAKSTLRGKMLNLGLADEDTNDETCDISEAVA